MQPIQPSAPNQAIKPPGGRIDVQVMTQTGPGTLAGRYMRRFWQPALLSEELVSGRAMPVRIMGEDLTIYRGEDGVAYAVASRCAHRGTQLSVGFVEGNRIRCLYHGWQYDGSGQCVERPAERDPHACGNIRIRSYPVVEYLGLVLVYLGEGNAPAPLSFPEFAAEGVREASFYERGCNYFQNVENGVDEVHIAFTHRQSLFQVLNYSVPEMGAQETKYGLVQLAKRSDGKVNQAHFMMPNMLTFTYPASNDPAVTGWALYLSWRVPIDDARHKTFIVEHFNVKADDVEGFRARRQARRESIAALQPRAQVSAAILAGKAHLMDYVDRPDYLHLGDDVTQRAQGIVQDRSAERLGRSDVAIVMLRRLWARDLATIESGGEPTAWEYPTSLPRPTGA